MARTGGIEGAGSGWPVLPPSRPRRVSVPHPSRHCRAIPAFDGSLTARRKTTPMARYLRPRRPGASVFFTLALADRGSDLLVREIGRLRQAVAATMRERPFTVEAWVVLPDHLHAVWTLPDEDADYSVRWGAIKARFTMSLRREGRRPGFSPAPLPTEYPVVQSGRYAGLKPGLRVGKREQAIWQRRFWGEARPEIVPVARFQRRTGGAQAAKPTISATGRITPRTSGIAGSIR